MSSVNDVTPTEADTTRGRPIGTIAVVLTVTMFLVGAALQVFGMVIGTFTTAYGDGFAFAGGVAGLGWVLVVLTSYSALMFQRAVEDGETAPSTWPMFTAETICNLTGSLMMVWIVGHEVLEAARRPDITSYYPHFWTSLTFYSLVLAGLVPSSVLTVMLFRSVRARPEAVPGAQARSAPK